MTAPYSDVWGIPVVESSVLPFKPPPGEDARRMVRHGLSDVLRWLGEDVGPKPGEETHMLMIAGRLHVSAAMVERLKQDFGGAA